MFNLAWLIDRDTRSNEELTHVFISKASDEVSVGYGRE